MQRTAVNRRCEPPVDTSLEWAHGAPSSTHPDMKTSLLAFAIAVVCTDTSAFGQGAAVIIKQRAKETAGRPLNLPVQGQPGQPATGAPAPQGAAQPNVSKVLADIAMIKIRPQATQELKDKLAADLADVAIGANKPSADALQALANSLADAIAGKKISSADQTGHSPRLALTSNTQVNGDAAMLGLRLRTPAPRSGLCRAIPARGPP